MLDGLVVLCCGLKGAPEGPSLMCVVDVRESAKADAERLALR